MAFSRRHCNCHNHLQCGTWTRSQSGTQSGVHKVPGGPPDKASNWASHQVSIWPHPRTQTGFHKRPRPEHRGWGRGLHRLLLRSRNDRKVGVGFKPGSILCSVHHKCCGNRRRFVRSVCVCVYTVDETSRQPPPPLPSASYSCLSVRQVRSIRYLGGDAGAPAHALLVPPPR